MARRKKNIGVVDLFRRNLHLNYCRLAACLRAKLSGYSVLAAHSPHLLPLDDLEGVILHKPTQFNQEEIDILVDSGKPAITINTPSDRLPQAFIDFTHGYDSAIAHLKAIGCRRIAHVCGPEDDVASKRHRTSSFLASMEKHGLDFDDEYLIQADYTFHLAQQLVSDFLDTNSDVDAFVCSHDRSAMGAINAIKQHGKLVPDDLAVVGCGNFPHIVSRSDNPLSTINFPIYNAGYEAMNELIKKIENPDYELHDIGIPTHFVKRQSTLGSIYEDPVWHSVITPDRNILDFIYSMGSSLTKETKERLIFNVESCRNNLDTYKAFVKNTLEAINHGSDPFVCHQVMANIYHIIRQQPRKHLGEFSPQRLFEQLHNLANENIDHFSNYASATEERINDVIDDFAQEQEGAHSLEAFTDSLGALKRRIGLKFIGLALLKEPCSIAETVLSSKAHIHLWNSEKAYEQLQDETICDFLLSDRLSSPVDKTAIIEYVPLMNEERMIALVVIDLDTQYSAFYHKLRQTLETKLAQALIFESLKEREKELKSQKRIAEKANKAKSEFLAVISHEIRTPLNCIMGMTELTLNTTELEDDQKNFLSLSLEASRELLRMITDILDFSRIESGGLEIRRELFSLHELLNQTETYTRPKAIEHGLEFHLETPTDLPNACIGDALRIQQMLTNLINNAIKFTKSGFVKLIVSCANPSEQRCSVDFTVADSGVGIPTELRETIFEAFQQADSSNARSFEGVGLGLAIVKRIAEHIDATISLESEIGSGSRFTVSVPLESEEQEIPLRSSPSHRIKKTKHPLRILVVDDTESNIKVAESLLHCAGHKVFIAKSGTEAIRKRFDSDAECILMDIRMPDLDGLKTTRLIREREAKEQITSIPIIALTAHADEFRRESCLDAGMNDYLTKPIDSTELLDTVENLGAI